MTAGELIRSPRIRMLGLVVTVLILFAMLWQNEEPATPDDAAALRGKAEPDAFVTGGRYLSFNVTGQLAIRIESQRIEQFESDQVIRMQQPRATLFGEADDASWELEAQQGEFLQALDLIHLNGNVRILRLADQRGTASPSEPMSLSTEALTLDSEERTVYTSEPVTIKDALGVTRATGMKAWIDPRILELNAQVEGRYEPGK
ncbi:LPS export ABC transporter periplasmic protein LptC [Marinobacter sp.]|uniref:LPS export ABC transporter periplasmic protein LptC n=1 Tax=Marinobacter sp. TaxID=50741 RepID=UPI002B484411|nr:LPS export ABC transporter periplasmic protein LptC [Marinobacter sp.]HKK55920.1 LPS export ABC transporter periplasmic protein LptC [Marinobacter sp.]